MSIQTSAENGDYMQQSQELLDRGDVAGALACLDAGIANSRAAGGVPPAALCLKGVIHKAGGNPDAAEAAFRDALQMAPRLFDAHVALVELLMEQDRLDDAQAQCRAVLDIASNAPRIQNLLGLIYAREDKHDEAEAAFKAAIEGKPDFVRAIYNLGVLYLMTGRFDAAEKSFGQALAHNPQSVDALGGLALIRFNHGDSKAAEELYAKALALAPEAPALHLGYAEAHKYTHAGDAHLARMAALLEKSDDDAAIRDLNFARGKAFEDIGEYAAAFDSWRAANDAQRRNAGYDRSGQEKLSAGLKAMFDGIDPDALSGAPAGRPGPVFIIGLPRSGTSLVEEALASHAQVFGAGELEALGRIMRDAGIVAGAADLPAIGALDLPAMAGAYLETLRRGVAEGTAYVTDKMPENFWYAGFIRLMFPDAKIIHCRRNIMDTGLSLFKTRLLNQPWTCDFGDIAHYHGLYADIMAFWHGAMPGFIHDVVYEDLVADFEPGLRGLLEWLGLEWDDACLNFHESKRAVWTASALQVRKPVYKSAIAGWKRYEEQLRPLAEMTGGA